ncbi:hypothetical protein [Acinetobacter junii]|uniref:Uncharacterized protein n=1 Tax=Acinetobacter junii TaxID=40215 RepID=A0ABU8ZCC1_ACIJU|nr:hypothetical protein [Acinetobacter junii]QXR26647.1 hypothetical protein EGT69_010000 [Acinetobacter junii]
MGNRTFVEKFHSSNEKNLIEAINRYSARLQLEISGLSVFHVQNSKEPFRAFVIFEKDIVITVEKPCETNMRNG